MPRTTLAQLAKARFAELRRRVKSSIPDRPTAQQRGYDARWRRRRLIQLRREPLCRICRAAGRLTHATEVDHIIPLNAGGPDTFANYQSTCGTCHRRKTVSEDGGLGHPRRARSAQEAPHDDASDLPG